MGNSKIIVMHNVPSFEKYINQIPPLKYSNPEEFAERVDSRSKAKAQLTALFAKHGLTNSDTCLGFALCEDRSSAAFGGCIPGYLVAECGAGMEGNAKLLNLFDDLCRDVVAMPVWLRMEGATVDTPCNLVFVPSGVMGLVYSYGPVQHLIDYLTKLVKTIPAGFLVETGSYSVRQGELGAPRSLRSGSEIREGSVGLTKKSFKDQKLRVERFRQVESAGLEIPTLAYQSEEEFDRILGKVRAAVIAIFHGAESAKFRSDLKDPDLRVHPAEGDIRYGESIPGIVSVHFDSECELDGRLKHFVEACSEVAMDIPVLLVWEGCGKRMFWGAMLFDRGSVWVGIDDSVNLTDMLNFVGA